MHWISLVSHRPLSISAKCLTEIPKLISPAIEKSKINKSIKVALVGNPNAGKSTLINAMMGLKICAASKKPHTTREYQRVFCIHEDTQIILLDTPGVMSSRTKSKFNIENKADIFQIKEIEKADLVGVLIDVSCKFGGNSLSNEMKTLLTIFPAKTEFVLLLNKVDLLKDKFKLLELANNFTKPIKEKDGKRLNIKFSRIFMISALKNDGVEAFVQYLNSVAQKSPDTYPMDKVTDHPESKIVEQRVKAALLEYLNYNIPYCCDCTVELMQENKGLIYCAVLIHCTSAWHERVITRKKYLEQITEECEKDLTSLFGKTVKLSIHTRLIRKK